MIGPGVGPSFYSGVPLPFPGATFGSDFTASQYQLNGAVYSAPTSLPGWTFTRASTGYAETAAGALVAFASGAPRITDKGLLVEESRINLCLQSQTFQTTWSGVSTLVFGSGSTVNALAAPDGTVTADLVTESTAAATQHRLDQTITVSTATAYVFSFYAKANGRHVWARVSNATTVGSIVFDLTAGTVASTVAGTGTITALPGGWYRCTVAVTTDSTSSILRLNLIPTNNSVSDYTGDGTSGLYLWGAQLEAGAFPTSYIPTTTASATRVVDFAAISGVSVSAGFTLISRAIRTGATTVGGVVVLGDSTSANRALSYASSLTDIKGLVSASGSVAIAAQGTIVSGTAFGSGISFDGVTTARYSSQGGGPATITKALVPATITTLGLGGTTGGTAVESLNGYLQRAIIYPTAFTDAQLIAATA